MNNFKDKDPIGVEGMTSLVLRTDKQQQKLWPNCR
jgi:hypothetical protein